MRVSKVHLDIIVSTIKSSIDDASVFLFGSRIDDSKRGGDIDIFIITGSTVLLSDKIQLLTQFEQKGIHRKVDLIINSANWQNDIIFNEVKKKGIQLC